VVLLRRTNHRLRQIERLEVLGAYLIAYLNLDRVIKIIRTEDEPKPVLIRAFKLNEVQADAILNMRLRNLRKLEEMEIRGEDKNLRAERKSLRDLLGSEKDQWKKIGDEIKAVRTTFGPKTPLGKRRSTFAQAPAHDEAAIEEAMVIREPITVVVSQKGWIRALKGTVTDLAGVAFKGDDGLRFAFPAETTSKCRSWPPTDASIRSRREASGQARPWRAGSPVHRYRAGVRPGVGVSGRGRSPVPGREPRGQGLHRPEDECIANTRKASRSSMSPCPTRPAP
jgi:topoisomerase-4 subunit A